MDRENIFALARENGATSREAERFCEIVAAEVAKEREECAKVCEGGMNTSPEAETSEWMRAHNNACRTRAIAIRQRSNCEVSGLPRTGGNDDNEH